MNNGVKEVAINAMIACVYAALTIACSSIAYGGIQFRISEIFNTSTSRLSSKSNCPNHYHTSYWDYQ